MEDTTKCKPRLEVTVLDVGWGDSILLSTESCIRKEGKLEKQVQYALIDCNDYLYERSSLIYVKRYFDRAGIKFEDNPHNFHWMLLTHGHADHARGIKRMMRTFGTEYFWYPDSTPSVTVAAVLKYAKRSRRVKEHHPIAKGTNLTSVKFGEVTLEVLWPDGSQLDPDHENNNSVVLAITLNKVTFVFTGDAEAKNWHQITLPASVQVFQAPHHGAKNGMIDKADKTTPWLDALQTHPDVIIALSSHIRPHRHPHPEVIEKLKTRNFTHFRTDQHYHLRFETDGNTVSTKYFR